MQIFLRIGETYSYLIPVGTCSFYWAFYLTAGGAVLTLLTAMFSCCASTPKRDRPYADV